MEFEKVNISVVWCGGVGWDVVWYGMVWYGMVWYGMVWYGMVWYGIDLQLGRYIFMKQF